MIIILFNETQMAYGEDLGKRCWHHDLNISHLTCFITLIIYVHQSQLSHLHAQISPPLVK